MQTSARSRAQALTYVTRRLDNGSAIVTATKRAALGPKSVGLGVLLSDLSDTPMVPWLESAERDAEGHLRVQAQEPDGLVLSPQTLAALEPELARRLGCPEATRLKFDVTSKGHVMTADFRLLVRFVQAGGIAVRAQRLGGFVRYDGRDWRLPEPLYSACVAAEALQEPDEDASRRIARFAAFKAALPDDLQADLQDGYVRKLRMVYADAFSLDLDLTHDDVHFAPRLFAHSREAEADTGGDLPDAQDAALLTPKEQEKFSKEGFWRRPDNPSAYALGENTYVYVAPALREALRVVREVRTASPAVRRAFVLNPRAVLADKLPEDARSHLEHLFVETQQYSERVAGIDTWTQTVLPWIKKVANTWLPEAFGLMIGDVRLALRPEQTVELLEALTQAQAKDQTQVSFEGKDIPVNAQAIEAVQALVTNYGPRAQDPAAPADADAAGTDSQDLPKADAPPGPLFLVVHDNLEEVSYRQEAQVDFTKTAVVLPPHLRSTLKQHQREGLAWMAQAARDGCGALLADDMGLGKTLQALTFLASRRAETRAERARPHLIVAPVALLANWQAEMDRHFEPGAFGVVEPVVGRGLKALRLASAETGRDTLHGRAGLDADKLANGGVVLTTYETLRDYHFSFAKVPFDTIVFDEAQKLKNPVSQMTRSSKTLHAQFKLALTGTPVENRLHDVWSIVDVIWPARLGASRDFAKRFESDEARGAEALRLELTGRNGTQTPLMLRRMKNGLLKDLPKKTFRTLPVDMPPDQAKAYADLVAQGLSLRGRPAARSMLETLQGLRSVSLHLSLPGAQEDGEAYVARSARLIGLMRILADIRKAGEKALIFVEDLAVQDFVARHVAKFAGRKGALDRIHGGVAGSDRQKIVDRFQSGPPGFDALVLSPKAGGVGLTITAANHVIHLSRWWNPAVEDQATDRAYRIGQTRDVTVHIPQAVHPAPELREHSFDLMLDQLLSRKRELSQSLLLPMNDDRLAGELYRSVFGETVEGTNPGPEATEAAKSLEVAPTQIITAQSPVQPVTRPILRLSERKLPIVQADDAIRIKNSKARPSTTWRLVEGEVRPFDEIFDFLAGRDVQKFEIVDPWALTDHTREVIGDILNQIGKRARSVNFADLTARHPEHKSVRDQVQLSGPEAIRIWDELVRRHLFSHTVPQSFLKKDGYMHDRWMEFEMVQIRTDAKSVRIDLTNGLLALADRRKSCTVSRTEVF